MTQSTLLLRALREAGEKMLKLPDDVQGSRSRAEWDTIKAFTDTASPQNILALLDVLEEAGRALAPFAARCDGIAPNLRDGFPIERRFTAQDFYRALAALTRIKDFSHGQEPADVG